METTNILDTNETCDSPVYVDKTPLSSPISSPVSSPVIISKGSNHEWDVHVTDKLILPELNETDIRGVPDPNNSASSNATNVTSHDTTTDNKDVNIHVEDSHGKEMVTVVVKDFAYCKEEFLKSIKENNLSVSPETIMRLLRMAMVIVEKTNETGSKKKEFVVNLLTEVVMTNDLMLPEHKEEALHLIKGGVVTDAIDFLIDATRGKFDVNKVEKIAEQVAKSCFTICFEKFMKKK